MITDHRTPGMSGLQLIEQVRQRSPCTLSILKTAYGADDVEQPAQKLNVHKYVTKTFPLAELKLVVSHALKDKSAAVNGRSELRATVTAAASSATPDAKPALGDVSNKTPLRGSHSGIRKL